MSQAPSFGCRVSGLRYDRVGDSTTASKKKVHPSSTFYWSVTLVTGKPEALEGASIYGSVLGNASSAVSSSHFRHLNINHTKLHNIHIQNPFQAQQAYSKMIEHSKIVKYSNDSNSLNFQPFPPTN